MIYTTKNLLNKYKDYSNAKTKINRLVKKQELFPLTKGIYTDDKSLDPFVASSIIYGPSYISFEKALEYYGLIPERVYSITCASYSKHKSKNYTNVLGTFTYNDVASEAYHYGISTKYINGMPFYIATAEKALCDMLYKCKPVKNLKQLKQLLFENLRIDTNEFIKLNKDDINLLASKYHCTNVKYLNQLIKRANYE